MAALDIGVTLGGIVAIGFLAWFFFGPKKARQAEVKPESTEGRPWGQPLKKPAGAPLNLG